MSNNKIKILKVYYSKVSTMDQKGTILFSKQEDDGDYMFYSAIVYIKINLNINQFI